MPRHSKRPTPAPTPLKGRPVIKGRRLQPMTTQTQAQFVSALRSLASDWETLKTTLEARAKVDEKEGFVWTAQVELAAAAALDGCVKSVKDLLPKDPS